MSDAQTTKDRALIEKLGGPAEVARKLQARGLSTACTQLVSNWKARGIPSHMKVNYPDLFMPELSKPKKARA